MRSRKKESINYLLLEFRMLSGTFIINRSISHIPSRCALLVLAGTSLTAATAKLGVATDDNGWSNGPLRPSS